MLTLWAVCLSFCALVWVASERAALAQAQAVDQTPEVLPGSESRAGHGQDLNHLFRSPYRRPDFDEAQKYREEYLFGNWGGRRSELADKGVRASLIFISDPFWNVTGGLRQGGGAFNLQVADLFLNTEPLFCWPGGTFRVGFATNFGTNVSSKFIGNSFQVQTAASGTVNYRLTYLCYTQSLFNDKVSMRFGRVTINDLYGEELARNTSRPLFRSASR